MQNGLGGWVTGSAEAGRGLPGTRGHQRVVRGPVGMEEVKSRNGHGPALSGFECHGTEPGCCLNIMIRH